MSFEHSFAEDFYRNGTEQTKTKKPTSLENALFNMPRREWNNMCREVFDCKPMYVDIDMVMEKIMETNTVLNLTPPVEVYIDAEGFYSVKVWDETDKEYKRRMFK